MRAVWEWCKKHKILSVVVVLLILGVIGSMGNNDQQKNIKATQPQSSGSNVANAKISESKKTNEPAPKPKISAPKYSIVHELPSKRYDGGNTFYLLIDQINPAEATFKDSIRELVRQFVSEKGKKITIEVHDSEASLDISYGQYGDMSIARARTEDENREQEQHFVALFTGELKTNITLNTLDFYPATAKSSDVVGQYVASEEFNP